MHCGNESSEFQIKGSSEFTDRSKMVFNGLNELEEKHGKWRAETPTMLGLQKADPLESEVEDCTLVKFKRPRLPLSLKRARPVDSVPDYVMNPHKWKKYSLADTPDVTEESNTAAALQFLEDLKKRKEHSLADTPDKMEDSNTAVSGQFPEDLKRKEQPVANDVERVTFKKPEAFKRGAVGEPMETSEQEPEKSFSLNSACSSVHRMPELVVGEKIQKRKKSVAPVVKVGTAVKLDHLEENPDDVIWS